MRSKRSSFFSWIWLSFIHWISSDLSWLYLHHHHRSGTLRDGERRKAAIHAVEAQRKAKEGRACCGRTR